MVYVLILSPEAHMKLSKAARSGASYTHHSTERVPRSMVLVQTHAQFTFVASGSARGGTFTLHDIRPLPRPVPRLELPEQIPKRLQHHAIRVFREGGTLPPKTALAILTAFKRLLR